MAIQLSIAGADALPAGALQISPALVVLLLLTAIVVAVIYAYQPPLPQTMAVAFVPWIVTGAILSVVAAHGQYPTYLEPVFTEPGAYITAMFVPGVVWAAMLNLSVSRRALPAYHQYIGTMGVGAMAILWAALIIEVGSSRLTMMLVLVVVPVMALLATGLIALSIGFWSPDFVDYAAITGGFAVFGALVNGIATATNFAVLGDGAHTAFSSAVRGIVLAVAPGGVVGVDATHLWVWLFLVANVAIGVHVATRLAPYAETSPRAVNAMLGFVGAVGFALGFDRLLVLVVG